MNGWWNQASLRNSRALNAISNGVDQKVFKLINTCSSVKKKAWKKLDVAFEDKKGKEIALLFKVSKYRNSWNTKVTNSTKDFVNFVWQIRPTSGELFSSDKKYYWDSKVSNLILKLPW